MSRRKGFTIPELLVLVFIILVGGFLLTAAYVNMTTPELPYTPKTHRLDGIVRCTNDGWCLCHFSDGEEGQVRDPLVGIEYSFYSE